jgi:predicted transcriptional regulator
MNMLEQQIIFFLFYSGNSHTTLEMSKVLDQSQEEIQKILHEMDDQGSVIMKNGLYKVSSYTKKMMKE